MVLGLKKKQHRVPDLSRYDYYYENERDVNRSHRLSAAAAAAAGRSHSMVHGPTRTMQARTSVQPYRSYSLRPHSAAGVSRTQGPERLNSFTQRRGPTSRSNSMASNPASITVKTTEVKDLQGRTRSITKQTVRRINGYEYVETTTTTTTAAPAQDPEKHFDEFTTDFTDDLSFQDQQSGQRQHSLVGSPPLVNMNSFSTTSKLDVEEDEDDNAEFSDAMDYLPPERRSTRKIKAKKATKDLTRQRKPLNDQEMYAKALEAAKKKVYGERNPEAAVSAPTSGPNPVARMTSLRDPPPNASTGTAQTGGTRKSRSLSRSISQKLFKHPPNEPQSIESVENAAHSSDVPHRMTDDEMYAKALEIARKKYAAQQEPPLQPNLVNTIVEEPEDVVTADIEPTDHKNETFASPHMPSFAAAGTSSTAAIPTRNAIEEDGVKTSPKKKFKSFFSKVVQFSQENYGYQPKKDSTAVNNNMGEVKEPDMMHKKKVVGHSNGTVATGTHGFEGIGEERVLSNSSPPSAPVTASGPVSSSIPTSASLNSQANMSRQSSYVPNTGSVHTPVANDSRLSGSSYSPESPEITSSFVAPKQHFAHSSRTNSSVKSNSRNTASSKHSMRESLRDEEPAMHTTVVQGVATVTKIEPTSPVVNGLVLEGGQAVPETPMSEVSDSRFTTASPVPEESPETSRNGTKKPTAKPKKKTLLSRIFKRS
ncbi:LAFE_0H05270g1_1 [Lachancea fermentati]|uniref:LAFE_0H05270g1_1 n=1 Tax=Lachancea fermentati TaxID=4955 RepID=A0A1G4MJQ8_LACFM|nr:LAFE_0H05270g1_1 [Lachancea fermentati]